MKRIGIVIVMLAGCISLCASIARAADLTSTDFIIRDPVVGTGGGYGSSSSYNLYSAGNLNVSGSAGSSTSYQLRDGFLQFPSVTSGVLSDSVVGSNIDLSWTASAAYDGFTVNGYSVGIATVSGGPYTYTSVGNVTSYNYINLAPGTYYFVLQTLSPSGEVIATSSQISDTVQEVVSFSISDNSLSFGQLSNSGPRYATTSGGSSSLTAGNTLTASSNSSNGYTVSYIGSTLASGGDTIAPATITGSSTGTSGTNQFALALLAAGSASVPTSYDESSSNWNFAQNTLSSIITTSGPTAAATLNAYYLANAATLAPAGTYNTTVTYEMTANY